MKFLCLYRPAKPELSTPTQPTQDEMKEMGELISDMSRAGVLLATGGCMPSTDGARVRIQSGSFTVKDGPFDSKDVVAGFCLLQVKTKPEAIEWGKRFLSVVREGETEIRPLHEMG